ncbi:hypothetical protein FIBSPDRAFT_384948 [Athelia psychrophila]|uniref:Uncharacterized protein n=1 Tax=Athelia psychrophila TaxID=1759441 RepID=A0A166P156_9AGAM|nr:hypothetical protein FIBSPDRAFT_384948 [Fibularhizoctonia sp. CBS 109695]
MGTLQVPPNAHRQWLKLHPRRGALHHRRHIRLRDQRKQQFDQCWTKHHGHQLSGPLPNLPPSQTLRPEIAYALARRKQETSSIAREYRTRRSHGGACFKAMKTWMISIRHVII